jgi:phage tail-like protein
MDANGLRFWMLADKKQWLLHGDPPHLQYDTRHRSLCLQSERQPSTLPGTAGSGAREAAVSALERIPQTRDSYGTRAYWETVSETIMATGALPDAIPLFKPPPGEIPSDLAMGYDGVLYMAIGGRIVMLDRQDRWRPVTLAVAGVTAWRLAADPGGGVWILDRTHRQLARLQGLPLPDRLSGVYAPDIFRPCEENPDPPRVSVWTNALWDPIEEPVAIACSPEGRLAVLNWLAGGEAHLRCLGQNDTWLPPIRLLGAFYPYSLSWVSKHQVAVLWTSLPMEAPVYPVAQGVASVEPVGDFYPLREHNGEPFLHGVTLPPYYPTTMGSAPLHHLSLPAFARKGEASSRFPLDSQSNQTVWHRLYLEALLPAHCGIKVFVAASDDPEATIEPHDWHEHQFGEGFANSSRGHIPRGVWVSHASEIPYHPGLTSRAPEKDRAGLFTVLIQRTHRPVRTLRGRFLHVRVELCSDERTTPYLWALRAYASRFSYVTHYLPELYHESVFGDDANQIVSQTTPSTPADFLERFLDNFEGILTPLEDRIAHAYLLTDPRTTPDEALEWLGSWIGLSFDPAYPYVRRRCLLEKAPQLFRQHGTYKGLQLALNIATGGAVERGEIVILEDWRLRRVFATIVGADLADEADPLLAGLAVSGNSYVGETLFLGDENRKEFLALFSADLPKDAAEEAIIQTFFDRLAHRITVLVHQEVEPQDLGLIRRIVELETPAHVLARVVTASQPFMVGIASLVGVDTYLAEKQKPQPVRLGSSQLGVRDLIQRPASLDPRLEGGGVAQERRGPIAALRAAETAEYGTSFLLDGSASQAPVGQRIVRYIWKLVE